MAYRLPERACNETVLFARYEPLEQGSWMVESGEDGAFLIDLCF